MKTLQECLVDYDVVLLRAIAERRGVELGTSHRPEMVQELAAALLEPASVDEAVVWLTEVERRALDALVINGGRMRAHRFEQVAGSIRRFGPGSLARDAPWRAPVSPAEGLWYRGLIGRGFAEEAQTVVEFVFVPTDLRPLLPAPQFSQTPFVVPAAGTPYRIQPGGTDAVDDVCTLLALAQQGQLRQHGGELAPESADLALEQFLVQDSERLQLIYHVAQAANLLQVQGRTARIRREQVRNWLQQRRETQLRVLQEAWRGSFEWNDLWHVPGIRCEETGWYNDPLSARTAVFELLSRSAMDDWLSIQGFVDTVYEQASDYLRPDGDFESWYIRDARSGEYLTGFQNWHRIEGALLTYLLSGPLHWLGIVSLGCPEGWEKPAAFRLTAWGLVFLGLSHDLPDVQPAPPARVAPDATVSLPRDALLSDRFQLARIAEWRVSGANYVYALTAASLGRALGDGVEMSRIERFIQRISAESAPAAAVARIRGWAARYGLIRLRRAAVLETRTPQIMNELRAHDRIRGYLRQILSPTTALVRESDWEVLIQELQRAGYLPEMGDPL